MFSGDMVSAGVAEAEVAGGGDGVVFRRHGAFGDAKEGLLASWGQGDVEFAAVEMAGIAFDEAEKGQAICEVGHVCRGGAEAGGKFSRREGGFRELEENADAGDGVDAVGMGGFVGGDELEEHGGGVC